MFENREELFSAVIASVMNEAERPVLLEATVGRRLIAPESLPWEIGNAFSAMFKRRRVGLDDAVTAINLFKLMPIQYRTIDLEAAIRLAAQIKIYAYDAYILQCALENKAEILTLDHGLAVAARAVNVPILEVPR
jgi:predicted nucleic acid-binding protein